MKIKVFNSDSMVITQGPHGSNQGFNAIDCIATMVTVGKLISSFGAKVTRIYTQGTQSFFDCVDELGNIKLQIVHGKPAKGIEYNTGDILAEPVWHHYHIGVWLKGIGWIPLPCVQDTSVKMLQGIVNGKKVDAKYCDYNWYYQNFGNYELNLNINEPAMDREEELKRFLDWNEKCKVNEIMPDFVTMQGTGEKSKLINKIDSEWKEDLGIKLNQLKDWIQNTPEARNNPETDRILTRFAFGANASTAW